MRAWREALVLVAVALAPAALAVAFHPQLADRRRAGLEADAVRLEEVRDWRAELLWLDARSAADFSRGHIPQAVWFDLDHPDRAIGELLATWVPGRRIVVYCSTRGCSDSRTVAVRLRQAGFEPVFFLHGGWEAWLAAAQP